MNVVKEVVATGEGGKGRKEKHRREAEGAEALKGIKHRSSLHVSRSMCPVALCVYVCVYVSCRLEARIGVDMEEIRVEWGERGIRAILAMI